MPNFIESQPQTYITISTEAEKKKYKKTMDYYKNYFEDKLKTAENLDRKEIGEINAKLYKFRDEPYLTLTITEEEDLVNLYVLRMEINDLANKLYRILNSPTIIGRPPFELKYYIQDFLDIYSALNPLKQPLKDDNQIHELLTNILGENYQEYFLKAYNSGYDNVTLAKIYEEEIKKYEHQKSLNKLRKQSRKNPYKGIRKQSRNLWEKKHNSYKESLKHLRKKSLKELLDKYDGDSMDIDTTGGRGYKTKKYKKTKKHKKTKNIKKTKNVKKTKNHKN